ncbi:hypothetical protein [Saccharopolyspora griseoalba]|uniref:Uncharacterized protein n=1 Tax=Saccharopolyspora griseoalba TaxID=1431848 RepID=A0ABW2LH13_9PSEU
MADLFVRDDFDAAVARADLVDVLSFATSVTVAGGGGMEDHELVRVSETANGGAPWHD